MEKNQTYTSEEISEAEAQVKAKIAYYKENPQVFIEKMRAAAQRKQERYKQETDKLTEYKRQMSL